MPDSYVIDPSEFVPATPAKSGKAPIKINPADFKPATSGLAGPTAISGGSSDGYDKNWFDTHTQNLAQHAYHFLASKGHPDLGEAVHRLISGIGPHNLTEAATMGVSAAMPLAGKAAGALEEAAPLVSKGLELLDAPGLKGAAARTAVTAATGAATGGVPGAEQGAILQAAGEPLAPVASKVTGAGVADRAAQDAMRENAIDTVSHKALENELGMTTGQAQKLANPDEIGAESGAKELAGAKKAMGAGRLAQIREVGAKYEPIFNPIQNNPAPHNRLSDISKAAKEASDWAAQRGAKLTPATMKTLNELQSFAPVESAGMEVSMGGKGKGGGGFALTNEQIAALNAASEDTPLDTQTIGTLRGKLGQMMQAANTPGSSAMDRRVLYDASKPIVETLNDAIKPEDKPLLESINNEYAQVNRVFPFKEMAPLQRAATLPAFGDVAFAPKNALATKMAISRMNPEQQDFMRQAFASSVLKDGVPPTEILSRLQANKDAVKALYPDSKFGNIETWRKTMIDQKKFMQGPPSLPSQKQFEEGVQNAIKESGLTPEAAQAANDALIKSGQHEGKVARYITSPWAVGGALLGYGLFEHAPELIPIAVAYAGGKMGWKNIAADPVKLELYRQFISSGWTKAGGEMFGRLLVGGANDAIRGVAPEHQAIGEMPEGSGVKALDAARSEAIAPTPSASKRASEVSKDMGKGKNPEVHADLSRGRLSLDEVNKLVAHGAKTDATALLDHVPISEALDAAEVANPEERKMLIPLIQQKMRDSFKGQNFNRTLAANLAKRLQKLQAMA